MLKAKEMPETRSKINTLCNFQTMKSAVELKRLIEIPSIMSRGYSENFLQTQSEAATEV